MKSLKYNGLLPKVTLKSKLDMKMDREIDTELLNWRNRKNRKPLIVRGARQVGKTYSIEKLAHSHFTNLVRINFEEQIELKSLFKNFDVDRILDELSILFSIMFFNGRILFYMCFQLPGIINALGLAG